MDIKLTINKLISILTLFLLLGGCFNYRNTYHNKHDNYLMKDSLELTFTSLNRHMKNWSVGYKLQNLSTNHILFNGISRFNLQIFKIRIYDDKWQEVYGNFGSPRVGLDFYIYNPKYYFILPPKKTLKKRYKIIDVDYYISQSPFTLNKGKYFVVLSYNSEGMYNRNDEKKTYPQFMKAWRGNLSDTLIIELE